MAKSTRNTPPCAIVVLAAGKGSRMRSDLPKVMHQLANRPMIGYVIEAAQALKPKTIVSVIAPGSDEVKDAVSAEYAKAKFAVQKTPLGTGHAVLTALPQLGAHTGPVLILYGDTPMIRKETLRYMLRALDAPSKPAIAVLGMRPDSPAEYGRIVMNARHEVERIVEAKDASPAEKKITLCNAGAMAVRGDLLKSWLGQLTTRNAKGEYYLTDLVAIARKHKRAVTAVEADAMEVGGINSRSELADAEFTLQNKLRERAMNEGVTLPDPTTVYFSYDTKLSHDVVVHPQVVFGPGVKVSENVEIRSFSHIERATIGKNSIIGPFARLRPGAVLEQDVHIGNFVEIKQTQVSKGAKINHLSYIGDAKVGAGANIGAGTITCNYDGFAKHRTTIGDHAFIGSDTSLVAPVSIGKGAIIGAGSVITENVPADALALTRSTQQTKKGWAKSFRSRKKKKK